MSKQKEVNDQLQMAEDDIAAVNDVLSMLQDSKEVRTLTALTRLYCNSETLNPFQ